MVDRVRAYSVFLVICIVLALNFWFGIYTAEASTSAMLVSSDTPQANHQTFREDTRLTNSCIEAGESKVHCLCVTSISKHNFGQSDYKAAVELYVAEKNTQPTTLKAKHSTIEPQNYSGAELDQINAKRSKLLNAAVFEKNCNDATKYFLAR